MISLPKTPYIHRIYMVLANPIYRASAHIKSQCSYKSQCSCKEAVLILQVLYLSKVDLVSAKRMNRGGQPNLHNSSMLMTTPFCTTTCADDYAFLNIHMC